MKKVFLSMAALALIMAGCSKEEVPGTNPDAAIKAVPIQITQTVAGIATKAPVAAGQEITATVLMHDTGDGTADWSKFVANVTNKVNNSSSFDSDADRATVSTATFNAVAEADDATAATVALAPPLYYPVTTTSNHSHLAAVSPTGTAEGAKIVMKTVDGQQDVMLAKTVDAGAGNAVSHDAIKFVFEHLTTQLNFKMELAATTGGAWSGKAHVKSITIVGAELPKAVNVSSAAAEWTDAALFIVPGINAIALGTTAVTTGVPVMVKASGQVKLNVVVTGGDGKDYEYNDVVVKNGDANLQTSEGKSHEITLKVTEPKEAGGSVATITATATVKEWTAGDAGSADLK